MTRSSVPPGWRLRPDEMAPPPETLSRVTDHECEQYPLGPSAGAPTSASRRPQASPASVGNQVAVLAQSQGGARGQAGKAVRPVELCRDVFSDRCAKATHGSSHDRSGNDERLPRCEV